MLKHHLIRRTLAGGLVVAAGTVPAAAQARHATGDTFSSSSSAKRWMSARAWARGLRLRSWPDGYESAGCAACRGGREPRRGRIRPA